MIKFLSPSEKLSFIIAVSFKKNERFSRRQGNVTFNIYEQTEETKFVEELAEETKVGNETKAFRANIIEPEQDDSEPKQPDLIPQCPHQTCIPFPMKTFGKQQRSFSSSWYSKYLWLHYQEGSDSVLCFYCLLTEKCRLPVAGNWDLTVSRKSFSNWKKALEKFDKHQNFRKN